MNEGENRPIEIREEGLGQRIHSQVDDGKVRFGTYPNAMRSY